MAATNKRKQETSFTLKDVLIVLSAMLTAIAPLIANDVRIHSLQNDVATLTEQARSTHDDVQHMRDDIKTLTEQSAGNEAILKQLSTREQKEMQIESDINVIKSQVNDLQHRRR